MVAATFAAILLTAWVRCPVVWFCQRVRVAKLLVHDEKLFEEFGLAFVSAQVWQ
jgi:hypothetical protein